MENLSELLHTFDEVLYAYITLNVHITDREDCSFVRPHESRGRSGWWKPAEWNYGWNFVALWWRRMVDETLYNRNDFRSGVNKVLKFWYNSTAGSNYFIPKLFYGSISTRAVGLRKVEFAFKSTFKQAHNFIAEMLTAVQHKGLWQPKLHTPVFHEMNVFHCICGLHGVTLCVASLAVMHLDHVAGSGTIDYKSRGEMDLAMRYRSNTTNPNVRGNSNSSVEVEHRVPIGWYDML